MNARVPKQPTTNTLVAIQDTIVFTHKLWILSLLQSDIGADKVTLIEDLYCKNLKTYSKEASDDFEYDMDVLDRAIKQEEENNVHY